MITGNKTVKIKAYLPIDHCAEGFGYTKPVAGEEIIGIPYQFYSDQSPPFIEHWIDGVRTQTVNALDVSVIEFE
jgi:hypothetical protein